MGELWRSQPMQLVQLFIQIDAAHDTVDELGQLGLIQFIDLNPNVNAFQRNFVTEVKMADEMERKLRFFEEQIEKANADLEIGHQPIRIEKGDDPLLRVKMDELEGKFEDLEKELQQMNNNQEMLNRNYNELIEFKHVLEKDDDFFQEAADFGRDEESVVVRGGEESEGLLGPKSTGGDSQVGGLIKLGFITGVINRAKFPVFERLLFRATHGNRYVKYAQIDQLIKDPQNGEPVSKNVFIIFFSGEKLQAKIKKLCESFGANLYPCPETAQERSELSKQILTRIDDLNVVLARTLEHRRQVLSTVAVHLESWKTKVKKEKAIFHTMNMFNYDVGRRCLIAEGWTPASAIKEELIQKALRKAKERSGALVPSIMSVIATKEQPPTYFKTNKFTRAYQGIIDSYGIARYGEVNPAPLSIITFPFLFAIMFGDVGHGFLMLFFTFFLLYKEKDWEKKKLNEMIETPFNGRYVLLLMSLFSIYTGFLYNELFSVPLDLCGTNWKINTTTNSYYIKDIHRTYEFGVDPVWKGNDNELLFYNSLKMKLSIILGVTQMCVGIFLKMLNGIHFNKWIEVIWETIPQMTFMVCIFGYLSYLIFYKWLAIPFALNDQLRKTIPGTPGVNCTKNPGTQDAPMLINVMIYMFLGIMDTPYSDSPNYTAYKCLVPGQWLVQLIFVLAAVISVPLMLLVKPCVMNSRHKRAVQQGLYHHVDNSDHPEGHQDTATEHKERGGGHGGGHGEHGEEEFDFGEFFVHQIIETIEFVLGAISNTASYLRLWALSLAHSELSTVFWKMLIIEYALEKSVTENDKTVPHTYTYSAVGIPLLFVTASIWLAFTIGVLMLMESLSAFLHALRLHWVEFQNKFYKGDGVKFLPFSYERLLSGETDE
eukprot:TRINITY_DN1237_c0_g1_i1.p1 TRINITY_DN1237_c0_g1~~TRINITY_DN1237_c0_g1_i1.p1  ORF type:complete len:883 (-),score=189.89 TRINITY_DN1237_c0_g1_i1:64-2712(-)